MFKPSDFICDSGNLPKLPIPLHLGFFFEGFEMNKKTQKWGNKDNF